MLVTCKSINGSDIPLYARRSYEMGSERYGFLTVGKSYDVDAILIFNERSEYLINTEEDRSALFFFPSCLFTVKSHVMEKDWRFVDLRTIESYSYLCNQCGGKYMIGYKELVESYDHYEGLIIEREEKDILIYLNYKKTALNEKKILLKEELALKHQNDGWEDWSAR